MTMVLADNDGYRARPVELDYHFGSICEACTFFVHHRVHIHPPPPTKRQVGLGRPKIFDSLLERFDQDAS